MICTLAQYAEGLSSTYTGRELLQYKVENCSGEVNFGLFLSYICQKLFSNDGTTFEATCKQFYKSY